MGWVFRAASGLWSRPRMARDPGIGAQADSGAGIGGERAPAFGKAPHARSCRHL